MMHEVLWTPLWSRSHLSHMALLLRGCSALPASVFIASQRRRETMAATAAHLPSWHELSAWCLGTLTGARLKTEDDDRGAGRGPPHRSSNLRLFGAQSAEEVRVTLYRDSAAWCPYCQKLWIMLEEKRVPYRVELINMRSYGDKPESFLKKCPRGLLPALELDGKLYTESLEIMAMIDQVFQGPEHRKMLPNSDSADWRRMQELLSLERELFGSWCSYVFRGGPGGRRDFERTLKAVEQALGQVPGTPWFLDLSDAPSLVDLQYVSHIERMAASLPYWKGHAIRGIGTYPNLDRWFDAFDQRPAYVATKSDWYTHIKDIPPQYGEGVSVPESSTTAAALVGGDESWQLPLPPLASSTAPSDTLQPGWETFEAGAPHEAAFRVLVNHDAIVKFMARGAGTPGHWSRGRPDRAELADPYAKPATGAVAEEVDAVLRVAVALLLDGAVPTKEHSAMLAHIQPQHRLALAACTAYLRDRVGVPRDMSFPAARCLRGSMNWVAANL